MEAAIKTKYRREIVLENGNFNKYADDSLSASIALNKVVSNPWTRVVSLETIVTVVVEPDPNLNEEFWVDVALQKYTYSTFRESWLGTWMEHYFG